MKIDLHVHTWNSDGGCSPEQVFAFAANSGIGCVALTDHDQISDWEKLAPLAAQQGIRLLRGVEVSATDKQRGRRIHILCYLPEREEPGRLDALRRICGETCAARRRAGEEMTALAAKRFPITLCDVERTAAHSNAIFKQHIMQTLMQAGFASQLYGPLWAELFHNRRGSCLREVSTPDVLELLNTLRGSGCVTVLAHPFTYDSLDRMQELTDAGLLDGIEVWQSKTSTEQEDFLLSFAQKNKLIPTGGSDFHGMTASQVAPLGAGLTPEPSLAAIFALLRRRNPGNERTN